MRVARRRRVSRPSNRVGTKNSGGGGGGGATWGGQVINQFATDTKATLNSTPITCTPNALQFFVTHFSTNGPTAVTGNGLTWVKYGEFPANNASVWVAQGASPSTAAMDYSGHGGSTFGLHRFEVTGVYMGASPLDVFEQSKAAANAAGTSHTLTFDTALTAGNGALGVAITNSPPAADPDWTPPLVDMNTGGIFARYDWAGVGPAASVVANTITVTRAGSANVQVLGFEIRPSTYTPPVAPSFVAAGTLQVAAGVATMAVTLPTCNIGELRLVHSHHLRIGVTSEVAIAPAGWNIAYCSAPESNGSNTTFDTLFYRVKQSGDPDSITITYGPGGSSYPSVVPYVYKDVHATAPVGVVAGAAFHNTANVNLTTANLTATAGATLLSFVGGTNMTDVVLSAISPGTERSALLAAGNMPFRLGDIAAVGGSQAPPAWARTGGTGSATSTMGVISVELRKASYVPNLAAAILGRGPSAFWKLNDAADPLLDSGPIRRNGVGTSLGYRNLAGLDGDSYVGLTPDGGGDNVSAPNSDVAGFSLANGLTIFMCVRIDIVTAGRMLISKGINPSFYEWWLTLGSSGSVKFESLTNAGASVRTRTTNAGFIPTASWVCIAVTVSGPNNAATIEFYQNSSTPAGASAAVAGSGTSGNISTVPTVIGSNWTLNSSPWWYVGNVAVFPRELSAAEIGLIMAAADADGWF